MCVLLCSRNECISHLERIIEQFHERQKIPVLAKYVIGFTMKCLELKVGLQECQTAARSCTCSTQITQCVLLWNTFPKLLDDSELADHLTWRALDIQSSPTGVCYFADAAFAEHK